MPALRPWSWLCDGGLEKSSIAKTGRTAELLQLEGVDLEHVVGIEELGVHLASFESVT